MSEIWKTRSSKTLLERPPWFDVLVEEVELPEAKWSPIITRFECLTTPQSLR